MTPRAFAADRIVTCDPHADAGAGPLGVIEDAAIVLDGDRIAYVGPRAKSSAHLPEGVDAIELGDRVVTPGLLDAHTHACWVGSRHGEYALRMAGGGYRDIAKAGGGIIATARAIAAASEEELAAALAARLARMAAVGVTTVEVKSGYGLDAAQERKQLSAIARVRAKSHMPDVVPTFLALHALPAGTDRAAYVAGVAKLVPQVAGEGLARFVDLYVDIDAFQVDEARPVGEAARKAGLGVRMHVGQFADVGGAQLAADLGATCVDHLEHVSSHGIDALARAGVCAVLLPVASFTLRQPPPPVSALLDAGVRIAMGSDANPGTAPTESLPFALAIAVRSYGLSPEQAILAATRGGAFSLGLDDRGVLRAGARADLVVWDLPHEQAIVQPWGVSKTHLVIAAGRILFQQ